MPRTLVTALTVLCAGLGLSACGGGSDDAAEEASAEVVARVSTICDQWRESLDARGAFPVEGFDPASPSADELPAVGDYTAAANAAQEAALASLRGLVPPDQIREEVDDLVEAVERQLESAKRQTQAALDGDVAAFTATLDEAGPTTEALADAAEALGASRCAF